jgi:hypothetical protein
MKYVAHKKGTVSGKLLILFFMICAFLTTAPIPGMADTGEDFTSYRIDPGEYYFVPLELNQGEGLYSRFHITYGEGIYFFIVDQDGHDDIMGGGQAQTGYEENIYYADDGKWYYVSFIALHSSTWYVWFSKVSGAPLAGSSATIEGHVRKDTDGPLILDFVVPEGNISRTIEVQYHVRDLGFPIVKVSLYANETIVVSVDDPPQEHYTNGFDVSGVLIWDTRLQDSGRFVLKVVAIDGLGHVGTSSTVTREVTNGFWDYTENWALVGGFFMFAALAVCYCAMKRGS